MERRKNMKTKDRAKIIEADLKNIIRKVKAGKPLTNAELKRLDAGLPTEQRQKIIQADIANIARKTKAGLPLSDVELNRLLDFICDSDAPPAQVGRRAILLHWLICRDCSQADLAERLGVSPGRVSQILNTFRAENRPFSALFAQAAKLPPHR
jgi:DNA-directed RNA polymerase specialized sigma24 family protein